MIISVCFLHDLIPYSIGTDADLGKQVPKEPPVFLPEGSTIHIWKPELLVEFVPVDSISGDTHGSTPDNPVDSIPGKTIMKKIKPSDNVLSIKGLAVDRIKELLSPNASIDLDQIIVTRSNEKINDDQVLDVKNLCDDQALVDFVIEHETLFVQYTEGQITFRERMPSLELEDDFFALFDL